MDKSKRRAVIAGNWKMHKTPKEAAELASEIVSLAKDADCDVVICVPFVDLDVAMKAVEGSNVKVGAQNCHFEKCGAYTGEVSADMLAAMGIEYVIVGHSERRTYFGDTDETVSKRLKAGLDAGLKVILCVGEYLEQRKLGVTAELVAMQTKIALDGVSADELKNVIIAYEPVWAIGTGLTATADQADEVCCVIRNTVASLYSQADADALTIQYGGSMKDSNAAELLSKKNVDGGLIGSAALDANNFAGIIKAATEG